MAEPGRRSSRLPRGRVEPAVAAGLRASV